MRAFARAMSNSRRLPLLALCLSLTVLSSTARADSVEAESGCGDLANPVYGPFDYRRANKQQRDLVENAHFTRGVETLSRTKTGTFGWDIGYTLRAFPNHHRALLTMQRLVANQKRNPSPDAVYTIECYYERALRFRPDDHVVRLLYANFLIEGGKSDDATKQLDYVSQAAADSPFTQFNVGMLYFDMKNYDRALEQAHKAAALGFNRPDLRDRLSKIGRWAEPPAEPASAASAASAP